MKAIVFECINQLKNEFNTQLLCQLAGVSRSGYYKWLARRGKLNQWQRAETDLMLLVNAVHGIRPSFGYRRIADRLRKQGTWEGSDRRVLTCMQKLDIQSKVRRKKNFGVGSEHNVVKNLLNRDFKTKKPMEKIVSDVTYMFSRGTVQYMSVFLDLHNNEILDLEVSHHNDLELVMRPLQRILEKRSKEITSSTIIHSDQGNQYTSVAYGLLLKSHGIRQSMSRKGTPLDNAPVESFFGWFKDEVYADYKPTSPEELRKAVILHALFHNHERPQRRLKNKAPIPYRNECS
ncbi:IS3 family transposase [Cohnella sp. CFH 77786]|uniref:IS3 family transposase n=1 Tax=Cohnella sp. CFH 77786 TaxID=2662265 RepID=UPI001C60C803|nr:IS3 family transposase [Cohnella sp. CFH 77786]MBW5445635.1 IS3 family transposase [Cohnella sp. CFH 77786]